MSQDWQNPYPPHRYRIFFVDDAPYFVDTVRDVLEGAGYTVFTARTKEDAVRILSETHIHLGIFDINLDESKAPSDDSESHDRSGLELAGEVEFPPVRMMYTVKVNRQLIIEALRLEKVVDYITKDEDGPTGLLSKVGAALKDNLAINYDLAIHWENGSLMQLAQEIEPALTVEALINRVIELEDLFRMQFYAIQDRSIFRQISLELLPMKKVGRQWLKVTAYTDQNNRYEYLLLCGKRELLGKEYHNFENALGSTPQYRIAPPVETVHYRINAYEVFNNSLRELASLKHYYRRGDHELVSMALHTLPDVRFRQPLRYETSLKEGKLYSLARGGNCVLSQEKVDHLYDIVERIADEWRLYATDSRLEVQAQSIRYDVGDMKMYPNPVFYLEKLSREIVQRAVGMTHGDIGLETVFARESDGALFLIDYGDSGSASILRDFVTLERSVHLLELSQADLGNYETLAYVLSALEDENTSTMLPPTLHKAVHLIQEIRHKALALSGHSLQDYLQDLYIDFMVYLLSYPDRPHAGYQTVRQYSHCLLFAAQLCHDWVGSLEVSVESNGRPDIWLDVDHNRVRVLGQFFYLTPHQFGIFQHLYERLGEECSYTDIIRFGLQENPLDDLEHDKPRIHTAMSRLRNRVQEFGFTIESWKNGYYMVKNG
jgi:DNA-binding response OmpR family regulator